MNLQGSSVTEGDFLDVVRVLADLVTMEGTLQEKRVALMRDLASLIGAEKWWWGFAPLLEPGKQPVYLVQNFGGFDDEGFSRLAIAVEHPDTGAMTAPLARAMMECGSHVTRMRQDIIPDERFLSSPARPEWEKANVGPIILSIRPLPSGGISCAGFYRQWSAPEFTARESRLAHLVLTGVPWLHESESQPPAADAIPKLPPRCRLVLMQLTTGRSRKEIADDLDLSLHTVNDYIKQIFRHFGVHSQTQLVTKLRAGDGRDHA